MSDYGMYKLEPYAAYDPFILGIAENPITYEPITIYNKDQVITHLTQLAVSDGEEEEQAYFQAVEYFTVNLLPLSPHMLFCSALDYTLLREEIEEDLYEDE